jgi:hypothetical protein
MYNREEELMGLPFVVSLIMFKIKLFLTRVRRRKEK